MSNASSIKNESPTRPLPTRECRSNSVDTIDQHVCDIAFVDLFLTENCNCRCTYCFVEEKNAHPLTPELARRTVDFLIEHSGNQTELGILLFGGEPLLEFDLIREISHYCRKATAGTDKSITFSMTTNGTVMTESMMEFFAKNDIRYLLSLDGDKPTQDVHRPLVGGGSSFDSVAEKLPLMKAYQPWQGARVTPMPDTVHRLAHNIQTLFEMSINQFIIGMATGVSWDEEKCSIFLEQMKKVCKFYVEKTNEGAPIRLTLFEKGDLDEEDDTNTWGCGAGRGRIGVSTRGEIFGCGRFVGLNNSKGALPIGDIFNGFTHLENRVQLLDDSAWKRIDCIHCNYRDRCNGGCPAVNYEETGSVFSPAYGECQSTRVYSELLDFSREYIKNNLEVEQEKEKKEV